MRTGSQNPTSRAHVPPMRRDVIVIGAAEEGLALLSKLTNSLPAGFPAAVLVVLRTQPRSLAVLEKIMSSYAALPVALARQAQELRPGRIYLAPPGSDLVIRAPASIGVEPRPRDSERRVVDRLFASSAAVFGSRVIGVLLSGCDGDGIEGLSAIEKADGIAVVQDPGDADVSGMTRHALADHRAHYVAPINGMGSLLTTLAHDAPV